MWQSLATISVKGGNFCVNKRQVFHGIFLRDVPTRQVKQKKVPSEGGINKEGWAKSLVLMLAFVLIQLPLWI